MRVIENAAAFTAPEAGEKLSWIEHLRSEHLSIGTYSVPAGEADTQEPHTEDEVYVVVTGRARLETDSGSADVGPGSVIFVPAGEGHRFVDIAEDLAVLVVFAPPEYSAR
jgi:mannose-6-phosphate isomerase-like protein (cupin superfamily)